MCALHTTLSLHGCTASPVSWLCTQPALSPPEVRLHSEAAEVRLALNTYQAEAVQACATPLWNKHEGWGGVPDTVAGSAI